ncbi:MAG: SDR family NAD(P)-dependent oxidoreductase [Terriglobia bacterium]
MHMDLEADLGIDSIKRVEILAAMWEAVPFLPEVMASDMAALRTLGDVVRFLGENVPTENLHTPPAASAAEPLVAAPALERYAVRMVAEEAIGLPLAGLRAGGRVVVTDDGDGIAQAVVRRLAKQGVVAEVVAEVPADADAVIFLGGLRTVQSGDDAIAVNREAFRAARAVAARYAARPGVFVGAQDTGAVRRSFADIRTRFGPIKALIHGAGVLADKRLIEKTDAQFDRVFDTKVQGLRALLEAAQDDDLAWICLFSSFVAKAGNAGQCDYAMANEILNLVACAERARRGTLCVVRAIGWGPWEGGMVTPPLRKHFQSLGVPLITLEAGARAFVAEGSPADDVVVLAGGDSISQALPAKRERDTAFDLWVDDANYPYLRDHALNGVPVVPIALVIEWFFRAMRGVSPGRTPVLRSLKVLRGIKLDAALRGELLQITRRSEEGKWRLELRGPGDLICYSATAEFESSSPDWKAVVEPAGAATSDERIYDGVVLFHGPAFQALRSLDATDHVGMSANVAGLAELGWKLGAWQTDPAAIDGMLQIGLKWSEKLLGGATLPMAFRSFHLFAPGAARGRLRTTAWTRHVQHAQVVCDVALATPEGDMVAVLSGAEFVLRPDLRQPAEAVSAAS